MVKMRSCKVEVWLYTFCILLHHCIYCVQKRMEIKFENQEKVLVIIYFVDIRFVSYRNWIDLNTTIFLLCEEKITFLLTLRTQIALIKGCSICVLNSKVHNRGFLTSCGNLESPSQWLLHELHFDSRIIKN